MQIASECFAKYIVKNKGSKYVQLKTPAIAKILRAFQRAALPCNLQLSSIINYDQNAHVRCRYIGELIRLVSDILDFTEENSIGGIVFSADFKKAFDSIEYSFLLAVPKSFGFGPQFIHWVRTIFKNAESCVMNNGHSTGYFPLERGTKHGDPLSASLFILCVETLFIEIRENEVLKGIRIGDNEIKLSAYADDADFLTSDVSSLETIFQACAIFQLYSSLKLNLEKSEACWIGNRMGPLIADG